MSSIIHNEKYAVDIKLDYFVETYYDDDDVKNNSDEAKNNNSDEEESDKSCEEKEDKSCEYENNCDEEASDYNSEG